MPRTFGMRTAVVVPHYAEFSEYACKHLHKRPEMPAYKGIYSRVVGFGLPFVGTAMLHQPAMSKRGGYRYNTMPVCLDCNKLRKK